MAQQTAARQAAADELRDIQSDLRALLERAETILRPYPQQKNEANAYWLGTMLGLVGKPGYANIHDTGIAVTIEELEGDEE